MSIIAQKNSNQPILTGISRFLAGVVFALGILVLAGWAFDIEFFKNIIPGLVAMNPTTAVCFILSALSFFLLAINNKKSRKNKMGISLAYIVLAVGVIKLGSLIIGID